MRFAQTLKRRAELDAELGEPVVIAPARLERVCVDVPPGLVNGTVAAAGNQSPAGVEPPSVRAVRATAVHRERSGSMDGVRRCFQVDLDDTTVIAQHQWLV